MAPCGTSPFPRESQDFVGDSVGRRRGVGRGVVRRADSRQPGDALAAAIAAAEAIALAESIGRRGGSVARRSRMVRDVSHRTGARRPPARRRRAVGRSATLKPHDEQAEPSLAVLTAAPAEAPRWQAVVPEVRFCRAARRAWPQEGPLVRKRLRSVEGPSTPSFADVLGDRPPGGVPAAEEAAAVDSPRHRLALGPGVELLLPRPLRLSSVRFAGGRSAIAVDCRPARRGREQLRV